MDAIKKQARWAGLLYIIVVFTAPIGIMLVPETLIVRGDAATTAENIRNSETLFRIGVASEMVGAIFMLLAVLALFRLFKPVDERLAWNMLVLGALISIPLSLLNAVINLVALDLASRPDALSTFDGGQLDSLAYLFLRVHAKVIAVAQVLWGLWLFPFGWLVIRSGFIPRFLGYLLFVAGAGYLLDTVVSVLLPQLAASVTKVTFIMVIGEVPIVLWLLIWGAKDQGRPAVTAAIAS